MLERWRFKTKRSRYTPSSTSAVTLMPDPILNIVASNRRIRTLGDFDVMLDPPWIFGSRHGEEVLELLRRLDADDTATRDAAKQERSAAKKARTAEKNAARDRAAQEEKELRRAEKEAERVIREAQQAAEKLRRDEIKQWRKEDKLRRDAAKPKRPARPPLVGSSIFNGVTATPEASRTVSTFSFNVILITTNLNYSTGFSQPTDALVGAPTT